MDGSKRHHKEKITTGRSHSERTKASHHNPKKRDPRETRKSERNVECESSPPVRRKNLRSEDNSKTQSDERRNSAKSEQNRIRGPRDMDSDTDNESNRRHQHHRHHKKRQHKADDESFEELSRRKRMIESQLNALDEEEAAASEPPQRRKRSGRWHSDHHTSRQQQQQAEPSTRIKREALSDDENDSRHRRQRRNPRTRRQNNAGSGSENHNWGRPEHTTTKPQKSEKDKAKPNFETSGKLAEDTNTFNGVVIKYNEPVEARKPRRKWRLYPFKGETSLPFIPVHRQSAYLLGRSRLIADIPIDHPSCSKQHAVLQFRFLPYERQDGTTGKSVRPYVIDLDSSNGTYVNNNRIDPRRYVELFEKDVLKFGFSTRVYVLLHEDSKNEGDDAGS